MPVRLSCKSGGRCNSKAQRPGGSGIISIGVYSCSFVVQYIAPVCAVQSLCDHVVNMEVGGQLGRGICTTISEISRFSLRSRSMSRGKIFSLILLAGLIILFLAIYRGCRSGSRTLEPGEFEESSLRRFEQPSPRYAMGQEDGLRRYQNVSTTAMGIVSG